jgi:DNA/RNA endonuclease YhcR with UshA esterase domain
MGTSVYLSTVVSTVAALPYVDAVAVTEARRLSDPTGTLDAVLVMGPAEVAVCDDDPSAPDRGRIVLTVEGGR